MRRFILDTNICLAYIRGNALYTKVELDHNLSNPDTMVLISVVTKAELFSLAIQNNWENKKLGILDSLLKKLFIIDINENDKDLIDSYGSIDAFSHGRLYSKPLKMSSRNMGKNDLWIAATAHVAKASLITTDSDFDHLAGNFIEVLKY